MVDIKPQFEVVFPPDYHNMYKRYVKKSTEANNPISPISFNAFTDKKTSGRYTAAKRKQEKAKEIHSLAELNEIMHRGSTHKPGFAMRKYYGGK